MTTPAINLADTLKNRMATQATAQATATTGQLSTAPAEETTVEPTSQNRIFYGEFPDHQNYLTAKGKTVAFYKGYCMTDDPEIIEYIATIRDAKEVTGKVLESDVPVPKKRERNRNWASAQGQAPHVFNPAELLLRAVNVANSSHVTQSARSDSAA